jgi:hypothetical protein
MVQTSFALKVLQISSNKEIIFVSIYVRSTKKFQPHTQTTRNFRYRRIVLGWVVDGKKNHTGTWITTTRNKNDSSIMIPLSDSEFLGTHFPILKQKSPSWYWILKHKSRQRSKTRACLDTLYSDVRWSAAVGVRIMIFITFFDSSNAVRSGGWEKRVKIEPFGTIFLDSCVCRPNCVCRPKRDGKTYPNRP